MALNGFSVLLFVPPAPEVLEGIKKTVYTAFYLLIFQRELSHNVIENKIYYDLATTLYYFFQIRKENELTGQSYRLS